MSDWSFLITAGIILLMLGFFLIIISMMRKESEKLESKMYPEDHEYKERRVKGGGVILIGPIPIVFGSDKRSALIAMILAIVLMLLSIFFLR